VAASAIARLREVDLTIRLFAEKNHRPQLGRDNVQIIGAAGVDGSRIGEDYGHNIGARVGAGGIRLLRYEREC
jgi:hypothetical protein